MQKAVNSAGEFMQKSMFLFDPTSIGGQPTGSASVAGVAASSTAAPTLPPKIPAAAQSYFAGYLPQEALSAAANAPPLPLIAPFVTQPHMPISYVQEEPAQLRKLFIGGLNHETTDEQLRDYYSQWGNVVDCIVIRDPATKHSRGFGFVTYSTIKMVESAMAARPHTINGKVVDPKRAIPREHMLPLTPNNPPHFLETEPAAGCKLILSGIHWDFHTVDGFRQYFEKFGEVEQVEIVGHPRGYGFVVFENRECAEKCLQAGKHHSVNGKKVEVKESTPNDNIPSAASAPKRPPNPSTNAPHKAQNHARSSPDHNRSRNAPREQAKKTTTHVPETRTFAPSDFPQLGAAK